MKSVVEKATGKDKSLRDLVYFPVIFNIVGLSAIGLLYAFSPEHSPDPGTFNTVVYSCLFVTEWLLAFVVIRRLRIDGVSIKGFILSKKRLRGLPAILVSVLLIALFEAYMIVSLTVGYIPRIRNLSFVQVLFFLALSPLTAGFVEELIWRGYFIEKLLAMGSSERRAIVYSSISFAFIHGVFLVDKLLITFLFGVIAGSYYVRERNLPVLMSAHVLVDITAFALTIFS